MQFNFGLYISICLCCAKLSRFLVYFRYGYASATPSHLQLSYHVSMATGTCGPCPPPSPQLHGPLAAVSSPGPSAPRRPTPTPSRQPGLQPQQRTQLWDASWGATPTSTELSRQDLRVSGSKTWQAERLQTLKRVLVDRDGLAQDWGISSANTLEIPQSCPKPSLCKPVRGIASGFWSYKWMEFLMHCIDSNQLTKVLLVHFVSRLYEWFPTSAASPFLGPVLLKQTVAGASF